MNVQVLFEARMIIETAVVQLATKRATIDEIEKITQLSTITYEYGNLESYVEYIKRNAEFHKVIADASANRKLAEFNKTIIDEMARLFHLGLIYGDTNTRLSSDHINLAKAIALRDTKRAVELSNQEINFAFLRVKEVLFRSLSEPNSEWPQLKYLDFMGFEQLNT